MFVITENIMKRPVYWNFKVEALDHTLCWNRCRRERRDL